MKHKYDPDIGATDDLSLRVSVATLVRVIFENPTNGELMLALERKATLHESKVEVKSQPFGGAIRILDSMALRGIIGDFHFDNDLSRSEQDFRIFIRPASWSAIRDFCVNHLNSVDDPILETDPTRELAEEFSDALKINLQPEQYVHMPVATVVENEAAPTENIHANGVFTVRVYRIFEAHIKDAFLAQCLMTNSDSNSDQGLCELALKDAQNGGRGRANAILALPLKRISDVYLAMSPKERNVPILFEGNQVDETVTAVLAGNSAPKYQRL